MEHQWFDISLDAGGFCRWRAVFEDLAAAPALSPRIARVDEDGSIHLRLDASPQEAKNALQELCALSNRHELSLNGSPCGHELFERIHQSFLAAQEHALRHGSPNAPPLLWIPDTAFMAFPILCLVLIALWLLGAFHNCSAG